MLSQTQVKATDYSEKFVLFVFSGADSLTVPFDFAGAVSL